VRDRIYAFLRTALLAFLVPSALAIGGVFLRAPCSYALPRFLPPFPGEPRSHTSAALDPMTQSIWFYGGSGVDSRLGDLWRLDLESHMWERVEWNGDGPYPLSSHAMVHDPVANQLIIYGGMSAPRFPSDPLWRNDVWQFSLETREWSVVHSSDPFNPLPLADFQMIFDAGKYRLWTVFGSALGLGPIRGYSTLDLESWLWTTHPIKSGQPISRVDFVAANEGQRRSALLFGGFSRGDGGVTTAELVRKLTVVWRLDFDTGEWTPLTGGTDRPLQDRAVGVYDPLSQCFLVFGGVAGKLQGPYPPYESDEVWAFDPASNVWRVLSEQGSLVHRRNATGAYCPCQGEFVIIGGTTSSANTLPVPEEMAFGIPIEHPAEFSWDGALPSDPRRSPWRWGTLQFADGAPSIAGFEEGSVRLVDCQSGETLQAPDAVKPLGPNRWHLRFRSLDREGWPASTGRRVVLTGRAEGAFINFLARVRMDEEGPLETAIPTSANRIRTITSKDAQAPIKIEWMNGYCRIQFFAHGAATARFRIHDVAGRLRYHEAIATAAPPSEGQFVLEWNGRGDDGQRLPAGIYFVGASAASEQARGRLFLP